MRIKFPYGSTAENNQLLLPEGHLSVDLERKALRLHDGVTQGGFEMLGEQAYVPPPPDDYITLEVAGTIGVTGTSNFIVAVSQDLETWTELNITGGGSVTNIPANPGLLYIRPVSTLTPNTQIRLGYGLSVGDTRANNLLGVVAWWLHDINLILGWLSAINFYVPAVAPPNQTNMRYMFANTRAFNQDISRWNVTNVTNMQSMFVGAHVFNQDISRWNVSSVTDMSSMFNGAQVFNQDLSTWYVPLIRSKPSTFDSDTPAWVKSGRQPQWGVTPPT